MMTKALDEGHRSILVPETTSVVFDENNGKLILLRWVKCTRDIVLKNIAFTDHEYVSVLNSLY